jgi:mono/diheme cytochrome c family protein
VRGLAALVVLVLPGALPAACRTDQTIVTPDPHLERMLEQEKRMPYESDPLLPGGMAMLKPPSGTLPVDAIVGNPLLTTGIANDQYTARIPVRVDRDLLDKGRQDFETFCAACHGILGDGNSVVADKMALRKPPSLHEARIVGYPPGKIFATVRQGYGLMPSYSVQLSVQDTWGVVAYVRALQLARAAEVGELPPDVRARLAAETAPPGTGVRDAEPGGAP